MSDVRGLEEWKQSVAEHMPHLSKPQAVVLAMFSFGMVLARSCGLTAVCGYLSQLLGVKFDTQRQRLRELLYEAEQKHGEKRLDLDPEGCFLPLLVWVLSLWEGKRLALALDATTLGDRFTVLAVSILYRGCAIPVAWKILPGNRKGKWRPEWLRLLDRIAPAVPSEMTVVVLADRGLYARWLYRRIAHWGWHPFLRINVAGFFRPQGANSFCSFKSLVPCVGSRWSGRGTAFKSKGCSQQCTLLGCWGEGHADPWLILTDLAPEQAEVGWYAMRAWIEHNFKITKRGGWQWQRTRMEEPDRASRLWVVVAVATLWTVSVGGAADDALTGAAVSDLGEAMAAGKRTRKETRARLISVFRHGLMQIMAALLRHEPLPQGRLVPEPWPGGEPEVGLATATPV